MHLRSHYGATMSQRTVTVEEVIHFDELRDILEAAGYDTSAGTSISVSVYQEGVNQRVDLDPEKDQIFIKLNRTIEESDG